MNNVPSFHHCEHVQNELLGKITLLYITTPALITPSNQEQLN